MEQDALLTFTSHIDGKNANVSIFSDRLEWEKPKSMSAGKLTAGIMTAGLSLAATGVKSGGGNEMIPVKSMTSVTAQKDGMRYWKLSVITSGNTIDFRVSKDEAQVIKDTLTRLMLGSHPAQAAAPAPVAAPAAAAEPDVMEQITKLAALRDAGILTEDEFNSKKAELLARM
jgi:hypothetical protein